MKKLFLSDILLKTEEFDTKFLEKIKESPQETGEDYKQFEIDLVNSWNELASKYVILSKVLKLTYERRNRIRNLFYDKLFRNEYKKVLLEEIPKHPFLLGENSFKWLVSFDWLIANDFNYVKILEGKYKIVVTEAEKIKRRAEIMKKARGG